MARIRLPHLPFGRTRAAAAFVEGKHDSVREADPYSFAVAHRRLAWMLRLSVGINFVLGACLTVSIGAFSTLLPLKEIRVALLRHEPVENRLFQVEPISEQVEGFDLMMEQMARNYVRMLLEIDTVTQSERLRRAFAMTGKELYQRFKRERVDSGEIQDAIDSGITRRVTVESVDGIKSYVPGFHKYAVDFVQTDRRGGAVVETKKLRAYLSMTTRPQEVRETEKYENPLGIRVMEFSLKERHNS